MVLVFILIVATVSKKKEGFDEFNFDDQGYIPYVSQDILCLIFTGAKAPVDQYGIFYNKCSRDKEKKIVPDTSNYCPTTTSYPAQALDDVKEEPKPEEICY
jgi:hypothetical protein